MAVKKKIKENKAENNNKDFAENTNPAINIINSGSLVELFKLVYKNKVVITLLVLLAISSSSYYYIQNKYLQEKNTILIQENVKLLESTKALKEVIRLFEKELIDTNKQFQVDLKGADKLTALEKKNKILYLLKRLEDLRNKVKN